MTVGTFEKEFNPAWWLPEGHTQTLWRKFSPLKQIPQRRQRLELDDGDFIDLDWEQSVAPDTGAEKTIVVILHGLCGCSGSPYVIALQTLFAEKQIPSVAMNFRGCSGEINRLACAYHSGISADLNEVFKQLCQQYPQHSFAFVGYSLGANVLLKWLGELHQDARVKKAVAVSTPFSLSLCSRALLSGLSRHYGRYFVRRLLVDVEAKKQQFAKAGNTPQLQRLDALGELAGIDNIWEFDDRVTAPLHGFKDADDYYGQCSSGQFVAAIGTDTLLIQSSNDPMIPVSALPQRRDMPANVRLQLLPHGGHVGFISGLSNNWLEQRIVRFVLVD